MKRERGGGGGKPQRHETMSIYGVFQNQDQKWRGTSLQYNQRDNSVTNNICSVSTADSNSATTTQHIDLPLTSSAAFALAASFACKCNQRYQRLTMRERVV